MKRDKNDQTIFEALREWLANHPARAKYNQSLIQEVWRSKMGPSIDAQTQSIQFKDGIVHIRIRSSVLKQELHMGKEKILNLLKESVPDAGIQDVRIH